MTVKIWEVPDGGLTDKLVTPLQTLSGHSKPVTLLHYHPTANNVIASAAKDPSLKVWRRYAVCVCAVEKKPWCNATCTRTPLLVGPSRRVLVTRSCHETALV